MKKLNLVMVVLFLIGLTSSSFAERELADKSIKNLTVQGEATSDACKFISGDLDKKAEAIEGTSAAEKETTDDTVVTPTE